MLKRPSKFLTSSLFSWLKLNEEKCELAGIGVLTLKKHKEKSRSSVFLKLKTWKWREFRKSYTENRDCFENLEDAKFNAWRENHSFQNSGNF